MELITWVKESYNTLCEDTDPRMKAYMFIQDPLVPASLIVSYLLFVYLGPKWMANRKAFEMQPVLIAYNFTMVVWNLIIIKDMLLGGWLFEYTLGCQPVDYSNSPSALRMLNAVWMFYIAKYIELLDTVFFILRKKNNQVSFLHVFHHGCLPLFWWWGVKEVPGGFGTFHALVNASVHVVMYFYYGLTALGPKYHKYLWWKRYVTVFQLAQFFIVTLHNSQYLFMECSYPWKFVAFIQGFTTIVAALFLNFYIRTYRKSSKPIDRKLVENGSASNGHAHKNGFVNGSHKNGLLDGHVKGLKRRPMN